MYPHPLAARWMLELHGRLWVPSKESLEAILVVITLFGMGLPFALFVLASAEEDDSDSD